MIKVENLKFAHKKAKKAVLEKISLKVPKGKMAVLLGPNGCGKSTLFMCLAGLWPYSEGQIFLNEGNVKNLSYRERAKLLAVVPQTHVPPFAYLVFEAVLMGRAPHIGLHSAPSPKDLEVARAALAQVGIEHLGERRYTQISGGERQLVLVARAIAQESPIIILDEPTAHLDFKNQYKILELIKNIALKAELTVLTTLHDPNLAAFFADQVMMLHNKTIQYDGPPEVVLTKERLTELYQSPIGVKNISGRKHIFADINPTWG